MNTFIKGVLFDLDGTIIDTTELVYQSYEYTLKRYNFPALTREQLSTKMGFTLRDTYQQLTNQEDVQMLFDCHDEFQSENINLAVPFKELEKLLKTLQAQNIKMGVVTSRGKHSTELILKAHNLHHYFDVVVTCDDVQHPKPHAEPVLKALQLLQVDSQYAFMTGDTETDILTGKNAGVKTIGVTYGFQGDTMDQYKPDHIINTLIELLTIIEKYA